MGAQDLTLDVTAEVWLHDGPAGWHFVTLPPEAADVVVQECDDVRRGFGSVRVEVTLGGSTWRTSLFPDSASGSFVLPLKAPVRRQEDVREGDRVELRLRLEPDP